MDVAVTNESRAMKAARPGRIIIVRHGRPVVIPKEGPPMGWKDYRDWWAKYELSSLKDAEKRALVEAHIMFVTRHPLRGKNPLLWLLSPSSPSFPPSLLASLRLIRYSRCQ